jgi:hypothetical protein
MTRIFSVFVPPALVLGLALMLAGTAAAAEAGRYVLKDVEGGFIRLDTGTGAVSHCSVRNDNWRCEPVADAQAALQDEINRLAKENAALEQQLAELTDGEPRSAPSIELPSDEDLDRVFGMFERFMQRFIDFARSLSENTGQET